MFFPDATFQHDLEDFQGVNDTNSPINVRVSKCASKLESDMYYPKPFTSRDSGSKGDLH